MYTLVNVEQLNTGDQIAVERHCSELNNLLCVTLSATDGKYYHHGIFYWERFSARVIEFWAETGNKDNARIQTRNITEFLGNSRRLYRVDHENCLPVEETMKLANEELKSGRPSYSLLFNNCETFATYLKTGVGHSRQVSSAFAWNLLICGLGTAIICLICRLRK